MSVEFTNFIDDNDNVDVVEQRGRFTVIQHLRDLSVMPTTAQTEYFMSEMGYCRRQIIIKLNEESVRLSPGAMQFKTGRVGLMSDLKGVGDLAGKLFKSVVTNTAPVKAVYKGTGMIVTESTYNYIILVDTSEWENAVVCDDGIFVACDSELRDSVTTRRTVSSAVLGGEGLFNLCLVGNGIAALKSHWPIEELIEVKLVNDEIAIDGNNAVCWSKSLQFTTEMSSRSLLGTVTSGEGLVNVYRGTGRILMGPDRS